jgi:ABC-type sugar transport system ATPase subunit
MNYLARDISKDYSGVHALDGVDLEIRSGEIQSLLGANGAGKSTLVKILVGAERPAAGTLELDGREVHFNNVRDARREGIAIVSQELNLFPELDVLQNLFMQKEPRFGGLVLNRSAMRRLAEPIIDVVGLKVPMNRPVSMLRLADQQLVEIARALIDVPKILFLDEPTSALQAAETERLLAVVRRLRDSGVAVVYVSHFLEDVFAISDTVTVLRNGRVTVSRRPVSEMTIGEAVSEMLGEAADAQRSASLATPAVGADSREAGSLRLSGAAVHGRLKPLDLTVDPGEVVGLAGLDGSGASVVLEVIFGRQRLDSGTSRLPSGKPVPRTTTAAVRAGVAFVPADRKRLGLMLEKPIYENVTAVSGGPLRRMGFLLRRRAMVERAEHWQQQLAIKMASPNTRAGQLSGGNQQKIVFAKWLDADPTVVLLDDPSRGVDVGAKVEMHAIIAQLAARHRIVIITSSELEELAKVCDRVVVFFRGSAVGELRADQLTEHRLLGAINTGNV